MSDVEEPAERPVDWAAFDEQLRKWLEKKPSKSDPSVFEFFELFHVVMDDLLDLAAHINQTMRELTDHLGD